MSGFEKTKLATGEFRSDFIRRRLGEGAAAKDIVTEINAPGLYSGPEGKSWPDSVVYAEKRKLEAAKKASATASTDDVAPAARKGGRTSADTDTDAAALKVAPEHEGILDETDMKSIREEAAAALRKKQRAEARKQALAQATVELEHEARLAAQRGVAKGDNVDINIDLAPFADRIVVDGKTYMHGAMVRVPRKVAASLQEQIQRTWQHQEGLQGKNENAYRKPRMQTVGGPSQGVRA